MSCLLLLSGRKGRESGNGGHWHWEGRKTGFITEQQNGTRVAQSHLTTLAVLEDRLIGEGGRHQREYVPLKEPIHTYTKGTESW